MTIRTALMLEIGKDRIPAPNPADIAVAKLLSLLPATLWACVPDVLKVDFKATDKRGHALPDAQRFNGDRVLAFNEVSWAIEDAQRLDALKTSSGLLNDTERLQQYAQQVHAAKGALRETAALQADLIAYQHFVDLCIAHNGLMVYTGRCAYQAGLAEGGKADGI